jgi:hypothetical protein
MNTSSCVCWTAQIAGTSIADLTDTSHARGHALLHTCSCTSWLSSAQLWSVSCGPSHDRAACTPAAVIYFRGRLVHLCDHTFCLNGLKALQHDCTQGVKGRVCKWVWVCVHECMCVCMSVCVHAEITGMPADNLFLLCTSQCCCASIMLHHIT